MKWVKNGKGAALMDCGEAVIRIDEHYLGADAGWTCKLFVGDKTYTYELSAKIASSIEQAIKFTTDWANYILERVAAEYMIIKNSLPAMDEFDWEEFHDGSEEEE